MKEYVGIELIMTIGCCQAGSVFAATDTHVNFHLLCPMTATIGVYDRTNGPSMFFSDSFVGLKRRYQFPSHQSNTSLVVVIVQSKDALAWKRISIAFVSQKSVRRLTSDE